MYTNIGIIYYKTAIKNIFANRKRKTSTRKYAHRKRIKARLVTKQ